MPSVSKKQHNFMAAVANNPAFAKKAGVPASVGQDFISADKGRKFAGGARTRVDRQSINNPKTDHGQMALFKRGGEMKESKAMEQRHVAAMKKAGVPKKIVAEEQAEANAMKRGGKVKKMASGGFTRAADGIATKGKTKGMQVQMCGGGRAKK